MFRMIYISEHGWPYVSPCYDTEEEAKSFLIRHYKMKEIVEVARYVSGDTTMIVTREVF